MKRWVEAVIIVVTFVCVGLTTGCHTVKGAGKDVEQAGKEIQKGSDKVRDHDKDMPRG